MRVVNLVRDDRTVVQMKRAVGPDTDRACTNRNRADGAGTVANVAVVVGDQAAAADRRLARAAVADPERPDREWRVSLVFPCRHPAPVTVTLPLSLVCGGRRLLAVKKLGWTHIPAHVCRDLKDELAYLEAERDENTCREPLTPPEALSLSKKLEPKYRKLGEEAKQEGQKKGGGDRKSKVAKDRSVGSSHQAKRDNTKTTREQAAVSTGYSEKTLRKVEEIQQAADGDAKAGTTHAGGTVLNTISLTDDVADRVPLGVGQGSRASVQPGG